MTTLSIDTATRTIGIGLTEPDQVLYEKSWHSENFHTVELAPAVKRALKQSGKSVKKIKRIAIAIGPGSYTGLRIGLAFAKGLAFQRSIQIVPIATLDILAAAHPLRDRILTTIISAGRGRLTAAHYKVEEDHWTQAEAPFLTNLEELYVSIKKPSILCGEISVDERRRLGRKHKLIELASPALSIRRPSTLAELAMRVPHEKIHQQSSGLVPNYLKSDAALAD